MDQLKSKNDVMPRLEQKDLKVGDKVRYQSVYYGDDEWENGIVKSIPIYATDSVFVVYHCDNNWLQWRNYTAALTYMKDLKKGWKEKEK